MPTRNVVITEHQNSLIEQWVSSGEYQNASEVLREGLRLVEQRKAEDAAKLARLRAAIQQGIDSIEQGEGTMLETDGEFEAHFSALADKAIGSAKVKMGV